MNLTTSHANRKSETSLFRSPFLPLLSTVSGSFLRHRPRRNSFWKRTMFTLLILLMTLEGYAQEIQPEMADLFRSNGKIYVVVFVIGTIFAGIILYMFLLERKMSRLENQLKEDKSIPHPNNSNS